MNIGEKIKKRRLSLKLTQKELGELLNVSQQMVGQWENSGNNIMISTLGKIADALDLHILDLLDDKRAMEYTQNVDRAVFGYYESIGYKMEFEDDSDDLIISHNGYGYKISFFDFLDIEFHLERDAEKIIKTIMESHKDTKFEL